MTLPADTLLGSIYLDPQYFLDNAAAFGAAGAIAGQTTTTLKPILASASRIVDAYCSRTFEASDIAENHNWAPGTRRITPNQPPLLLLKKFAIRTAPNSISQFDVTPVSTDDGGNNVRFGSIYYNRQENYLELASLSLAGSLTSQTIALGLIKASVEILYTSYDAVPKSVQVATAWIAASLLNQNVANTQLLPGIQSVQADDVRVQRVQVASLGRSRTDEIPLNAKLLLQDFKKIPIA